MFVFSPNFLNLRKIFILGNTETLLFFSGLSALLAHIFYTFAFFHLILASQTPFTQLLTHQFFMGITAVLSVSASIYYWYLIPHIPAKFKIPTSVYFFVITLECLIAILVFNDPDYDLTARGMIFMAPILFYLPIILVNFC
eukprot:TRINITY_DN1653_c0_g1_i4.p1 TRINITY_DN1653_c0_g1~~TRINITY_DN1653_c0_g1_i4.p1  ORF type:complete len:141 (+),score=7.71 TRINITY_DN1653_c0_g1_i4:776-1198(+)